MVMAQSLFISLKNAMPSCQIDVLAAAWSFGLLEKMPQVNQALTMPLGHGQFGWSSRLKMGKQWQAEGYDQAIVLPNSWKSALIPFFAKIPLRTGYLGECRWGLLNDARKLDKDLLPMTVQRFVALGQPKSERNLPACPLPQLQVTERQQQTVIEKFALDLTRPVLALCPGAEYGIAKRWPVSYFTELAQRQLAEGWQVWLLGSVKDHAIAQEIKHNVDGLCYDFTQRTSLAEAVDLLSLVAAVVSNDSGLMHIAAALNKKLIAIYGSSDPKFTPPLNDRAQVVTSNVPCSPCFKRDCPLYTPGQKQYLQCLTEISPTHVFDRLAN
jgi:heptosyltransferase-2